MAIDGILQFLYFFLIFLVQAVPGHKRAPSDASVASSEDDKVPPTPSTLESVTEKIEAEPVEDRTSDKFSDEGLGTSEVDKTEEEKLNEVSDVSNEDLASGSREPTTDFVSQAPAEPKPDDTQAEEIPYVPVVSQPEEPVDTADAEELVTDGRETEEELNEEQEEKREDEREAKEEKEDEQKEADTEESKESQPEDKSEKTESDTQAEEENKEPDEEVPQHKVTADRLEDTDNDTDVNIDTVNVKSVVIDTNINGDADNKSSVDESFAEVLLEKETIEIKPQDKHEAEAHEEAKQPEQDSKTREVIELEKQEATESTNGVRDKTKEISEDSEQVVASEDVTVKEVEEKATNADESVSQDAVSVPESEADSETKTEQGSPAVMKPDVESDSGSSSAADSNSVDLNLSISSFLSKSKEGGSLSMQVIHQLQTQS